MPEGPEVRYYAEIFNQFIHIPINELSIVNPRYTKDSKPLSDSLFLNSTIIQVKSHGKLLFIYFEKPTGEKFYMILGFGLTGHIYECDVQQVPPDSNSIMFKMFFTDTNKCIYLKDNMRFGTITITTDIEDVVKKMDSPDLMNKSLKDDIYVERFSKFAKKNITVVLINQKAFAGCGNYLKCEVLYRCHIHPLATVQQLSRKTLTNLIKTLRKLMWESFEHQKNGDWKYGKEESAFNNWLQVYRKQFTSKDEHVNVLNTPDRRKTYWVEFPLVSDNEEEV